MSHWEWTRAALLALGLLACSPTPGERTEAPPAHAEQPVTSPPKVLPRFVSFNVPNLHYIEDDWRFESRQHYRLPNEFEIRDALTSVRQMGGGVVRIYTLSVRKPDDPPELPRHVLGPGKFDEAAFTALDLVLEVAGELGVRIILPFVDNWRHWGGVTEYAAFRGKPSTDFWTDEQLISDFEQTISFVLTRRNTRTGIRYRDDPTILAWETGNELVCPYPWTARIAAFIKSQDPNHAVIDGFHSTRIRPEALDDPNVDLVTSHHYTPAAVTVADIEQNLAQARGRKPYFVGELGFLGAADVERVLDEVVGSDALGALLWSLRFHDRDGGFYWHGEKQGFCAYHWPGFESGAAIEERQVLAAMRRAAFAIRGEPAALLPPPAPPRLLPASTPAALVWRGSAGAESYVVERALDPARPWQTLATGVSDARFPYRPLFADETAEPGQRYFYRVRAQSAGGLSEPSEAMGPLSVSHASLVDELVDLSRLDAHEGRVEIVTDRPMYARMDRNRVAGEAGTQLVYRVAGSISAVRLFAFVAEAGALPTARSGRAHGALEPLALRAEDFGGGGDQPDVLRPVLLDAQDVPRGSTRLAITLGYGTQLGRVEIDYTPAPVTRK